ncbi:MAG: hypothetical protein H7308_15560 [Chthonomonadaceae bacterium]|nr:hypothetical protein [Chthonomonadaceae bacterium]
MIGVINEQLRIMITLGIRESVEPYLNYEFVLDTGYTYFLTLPGNVIRRLGLPLIDSMEMIMANGEALRSNIYVGRVFWNGEEKIVPVLEAEGDALLGMELLYGNRLTVDITNEGTATINSL